MTCVIHTLWSQSLPLRINLSAIIKAFRAVPASCFDQKEQAEKHHVLFVTSLSANVEIYHLLCQLRMQNFLFNLTVWGCSWGPYSRCWSRTPRRGLGWGDTCLWRSWTQPRPPQPAAARAHLCWCATGSGCRFAHSSCLKGKLNMSRLVVHSLRHIQSISFFETTLCGAECFTLWAFEMSVGSRLHQKRHGVLWGRCHGGGKKKNLATLWWQN